MLRCVDILHDTSWNLLEWRRAYIVMFYANKTQHYSTWYYVKESLFCIKRDFIVIFDPQNMGLDNFKNKIYQILSEICCLSRQSSGVRFPVSAVWKKQKCFFPIHVWKSVLWGASVTER